MFIPDSVRKGIRSNATITIFLSSACGIYLFTLLMVVMLNMLHKFNWAAGFVYVWVFYLLIFGVLAFFAFFRDANNETIPETGRIVTIIIRTMFFLLAAWIFYTRILPLAADTYYFFRGEKIQSKELTVKVSDDFRSEIRHIYFNNEKDEYIQVFGATASLRKGEKLRIFYLKNSRIILDYDYLGREDKAE